MIIGFARISTTEQNLGLDHDDLKPAFDASVDQADARNAPAPRPRRVIRQRDAVPLLNAFGEWLDEQSQKALHRLGHRDEARRYLELLRSRPWSTNPGEFWNHLEIHLLRSEAEATIVYDPIFPADPFAR
jgi:hypothetical protein